MGWTVLYLAFGLVALWLLGEVLLQYKARLRWRLLAFSGFLGVVLGVIVNSVAVIAVGAMAFAAGQTLVTLSFRKGFSTGWAIGGGPGTSRRRRAIRPMDPVDEHGEPVGPGPDDGPHGERGYNDGHDPEGASGGAQGRDPASPGGHGGYDTSGWDDHGYDNSGYGDSAYDNSGYGAAGYDSSYGHAPQSGGRTPPGGGGEEHSDYAPTAQFPSAPGYGGGYDGDHRDPASYPSEADRSDGPGYGGYGSAPDPYADSGYLATGADPARDDRYATAYAPEGSNPAYHGYGEGYIHPLGGAGAQTPGNYGSAPHGQGPGGAPGHGGHGYGHQSAGGDSYGGYDPGGQWPGASGGTGGDGYYPDTPAGGVWMPQQRDPATPDGYGYPPQHPYPQQTHSEQGYYYDGQRY